MPNANLDELQRARALRMQKAAADSNAATAADVSAETAAMHVRDRFAASRLEAGIAGSERGGSASDAAVSPSNTAVEGESSPSWAAAVSCCRKL